MIDEIATLSGILTSIDAHNKLKIIRKDHKKIDTEEILWGLEFIDNTMNAHIGLTMELACDASG
jgi:hypothetical protein